jgi:hypothetical protein
VDNAAAVVSLIWAVVHAWYQKFVPLGISGVLMLIASCILYYRTRLTSAALFFWTMLASTLLMYVFIFLVLPLNNDRLSNYSFLVISFLGFAQALAFLFYVRSLPKKTA